MSSENASDTMLGSREPRRQRGRERVAGLMAAAAALFVEKGFDATTMTEIAARAGAAIGSLYLFFPTKAVLAQAMATELADTLSARLEALRPRLAGARASAIADALFAELALFLAAHPVYGTLIDLQGEDGWKLAVRARRRTEIAALLAQADPPLPEPQCGRLAAIVPKLIRIAAALSADAATRDDVLEELRAMLRHHLEWPAD